MDTAFPDCGCSVYCPARDPTRSAIEGVSGRLDLVDRRRPNTGLEDTVEGEHRVEAERTRAIRRRTESPIESTESTNGVSAVNQGNPDTSSSPGMGASGSSTSNQQGPLPATSFTTSHPSVGNATIVEPEVVGGQVSPPRQEVMDEAPPVYDEYDGPTNREDSRRRIQPAQVPAVQIPAVQVPAVAGVNAMDVLYPRFNVYFNNSALPASDLIDPSAERERIRRLPGGPDYPRGINEVPFALPTPKLKYKEEIVRLGSYNGWRAWGASPSRLAFAGFFFVGNMDVVECFSCGLRFCNWSMTHEPVQTHCANAAHYCQHLDDILSKEVSAVLTGRPYDRNVSGNVPESFTQRVRCNYIINRHGGPQLGGLTNVQSRLSTFDVTLVENRWERKVGYPSETALATAGFFWDGINGLKCFYCAQIIAGWPVTIAGGLSPTLVHRLYFPQCFLSKISYLQPPTPLVGPPQENGRPFCTLCLENEANVVSITCTHTQGCMNCVTRLTSNKCILCRKEMDAVIQIRL